MVRVRGRGRESLNSTLRITQACPAKLLVPMIENFTHSLLLNTIIAPVSGKEGDRCVARLGDISNCDQTQQVGQMVMDFGITNNLTVVGPKCKY